MRSSRRVKPQESFILKDFRQLWRRASFPVVLMV
jgi:hypothetical protein